MCEHVYSFNSTEINKKEREICEFEMDFKQSFCPRSNRSNHIGNDDIISQRPDLKTGVKNGIFWSEIVSRFVKPGGTHTPRIPSSNSNLEKVTTLFVS